jgi:hypothetical protein
MRVVPSTVSMDRGRTKVAHRVKGAKMIRVLRKGAGVRQLRRECDSGYGVLGHIIGLHKLLIKAISQRKMLTTDPEFSQRSALSVRSV